MPAVGLLGMKVDTLRPMCGRLDDDGVTYIFKCKHAKMIWQELLLEEKGNTLAAASSTTEMFQVIYNGGQMCIC